ncbi:protein of unknown function (plasmid) [Cupriavidus taiwanensis]|uniref:Uncharacterized protein n=1 Tax=Cupriavidus taiwanensis TaxID=164546 RepID=A0A375IWX2_9BURK|nr:protein of unknown function [Cupriavidus taiwanensis]
MTDTSSVGALGVIGGRCGVSPLHSLSRESSATVASGVIRIPFESSIRIRRFPWRCRSSTMWRKLTHIIDGNLALLIMIHATVAFPVKTKERKTSPVVFLKLYVFSRKFVGRTMSERNWSSRSNHFDATSANCSSNTTSSRVSVTLAPSVHEEP